MNEPLLSVIICTYNRSDRLKNVLEDLKNQYFPGIQFSWEVVVVDNNSTDSTRRLVETYAKDLSIQYLFEPVQGKSFALNAGIRAARGEFLAFTDDDVVIDKYWVSSVHEAFNTYPHNCFGGKVLPIMEGPLPVWLSEDNKKYRIHGGPIVSHDCGDEIKVYDETMWVPIGANTFVRRKLFYKYGYYSTQLGFYSKEALIYGEDSEIMFRFKKRGEPILYYPKALVFHPAPIDRIKKSYFRKWCWGSGRGSARWPDSKIDCVCYLNVPRYLIRQFGEELLRWTISLLGRNEYKKFYHEMQLVYKLGSMYEFYINGD
jgi:glucosyl-dolichyl phosphate glucuronosyltransferase